MRRKNRLSAKEKTLMDAAWHYANIVGAKFNKLEIAEFIFRLTVGLFMGYGLWYIIPILHETLHAAFSPGSRISSLVPQFCAKTSSMSIYGHIRWKLICQYMF